MSWVAGVIRWNRRYLPLWILVWVATGFVGTASAQRSARSTKFKQLPPPGIKIESDVLSRLTERVDQLQSRLNQLGEEASVWRPDVEVFVRAVQLSIEQGLFYKPGDATKADKLLDEAERRLQAALQGVRGLELMGFREDQNDKPQPLVGGFRSRIDGSVQPYGLVAPAGLRIATDPAQPRRLDVWLHGRGDTKTEVPFLVERMTRPGEYTPADTLVLHPFGRHCNAFKFAGETDVYESMDRVQQITEIDEQRISIRGFSMGGAGCWHFAVHDPSRWFAANPGAGFVDTLRYQGWNDSPPFPLDATQRKLLHWYDVLPWAGNLQNTQVIAYSGEIDKQKQAADRVAERCRELGFQWPYVIGEGMGHKINPPSKIKISAQMQSWANAQTGNQQNAVNTNSDPWAIDFTTYTLRYSRAGWLQITGMKEHWTPARIVSRLDDSGPVAVLDIRTDGVTSFAIRMDSTSDAPRQGQRDDPTMNVRVDGTSLRVADQSEEPGFQAYFVSQQSKVNGFEKGALEWGTSEKDPALHSEGLPRKRPGLQGPIDDALTERFLFVVPSRPAKHGRVERWIQNELQYAQERWRKLMRGDVQIVTDDQVSSEMVAENHLICFGDFSSNQYLRRVQKSLPMVWNRDHIDIGTKRVPADRHALVFCYPNPENPNRYLVANSGLTFREFSNTSNSRQIAMLPDWALLDVTKSGDGIFAGGIVSRGFFDETWQISGSLQPGN